MQSQWIQVGTVGKAHGLRGHFYLSHRVGSLARPDSDLRIGSNPDTPTLSTKLLAQKPINDRLVILCQGVSNRDQLMPIAGQAVWIEREQLFSDADLAQNTLLWGDLPGRLVNDQANVKIGQIVDVQNFGASDVLIVDGGEKGRLFLPLIPQYFSMPIALNREPLTLTTTAETFAEFWQS
jgi:16S rRNA processing protein RimM